MARRRPPPPAHPTERLLGESAAIRELRAHIRHLVAFDTPGKPHVPTLLICGETGTGKGLLARLIHDSGPRAHGPFVEVNCAAIPESLLEAELFGFAAGAFTDAKRAKPGLFEAASGGTLFLDEIGALPLALQGKLLTAVEEKRVRRLGAVAARAVDVKRIAATQGDLLAAVDAGRFRADLYHRLAAVVLEVPPLRERGEDVILLARHFLHQYAAAHGLPPKRLSAAAEAWLRRQSWPGNVRELSRLVERLTLLCPSEVLEPALLAQWNRVAPPAGRSQTVPSLPPRPTSAGDVQSPPDEPARIRQALQRTAGNVTQAARLLGMSRKALRYRLQRYGIERPRVTVPAAVPSLSDLSPIDPGGEAQGQGRGDAAGGASRSPSVGWEQRTVAVLAVDLTLPRTAELTGAADAPWTATRHWQEALAGEIQRFGGVILRRSPPLLVAGFGLPRSLEQLPHRAVQAALAIRALVKGARLDAGRQPRPEVRLAVHLGPVLVDAGAPDATMRLPAAGETLALPIRLLGHAAPGEIVVSAPVGRLIEGVFALRARQLALGTGPPDRVTAYSVVGLKPRPAGEAVTVARSPLVGRERELSLLDELLAMAAEGHGRALGIVGEPGMGKSRLLDEWRQRLTAQPAAYAEGRCFAYASAIPYLPVLDLLRQQCGIAEADRPGMVVEKVHAALSAAGLEAPQNAPYLLHLLGVASDTAPLAALSPEAIKTRTFEVLRRLFLARSQPHTVIVAVEDVHWVDKTSEGFFASLAEHLPGARLLFLTTYRPGYRPPWMEKSYATQMALAPLSRAESARLLQSILPSAALPDALQQSILAKAEGNPFFLEELARAVGEPSDRLQALTVPDTSRASSRPASTSSRARRSASCKSPRRSAARCPARCWNTSGRRRKDAPRTSRR
jgi:DNA-binding NtrC family response regulator/class 3 adenylate cyclase